jgi:alpha-beta hydrolase superfamily lysophospholipase
MNMRQSEFTWRSGSDQIKIHSILWQPIEEPIAIIALVHGMGEHIGRYRKVAEFFTQKGIAIMAFDQRGHGKSDGSRGHISHFNQLIEGVEGLIERVKLQFQNIPIFLYGHSMGGNVAINYALKRPSGIKGLIITSPWLKLAFEPPALKLRLAKIMFNLYPSFTQSSQLNVNHLSRSGEVVKAYQKDKLVHDKISAAGFINIYNAGQYALQYAKDLKLPTLLMHGTGDKITSHIASEKFAEHSKIVTTLRLWPNAYHELHNEPEKEEVLTEIFNWMSKLIK